VQEILDQYGYLALAIGTFLEGETAILVASSLIKEGIFEGPYTVLFAFAGSFASDWLYYLIGRLNGAYFISRRPKLQSRFEPVKRFVDRYRLQVLLSYRFLYGFRVIIPLLIGMSGVKPSQYLLFSVLSGLLWAAMVSALGYGLGALFGLTTESFQENILLIMIMLACFGLTLGWSVNTFVGWKMTNKN
jgi:membrane protein DedA with SNARE-associated domain